MDASKNPPNQPVEEDYFQKSLFLNIKLSGNEFISRTGALNRADIFKDLPLHLYCKNLPELNFNQEVQGQPGSVASFINHSILQTDNIACYQNENLLHTRKFLDMSSTVSLWFILDSPKKLENSVFSISNWIQCAFTLSGQKPKIPENYATQTTILVFLNTKSIDDLLQTRNAASARSEEPVPIRDDIENTIRTVYPAHVWDGTLHLEKIRYNERIKDGLLFFGIVFSVTIPADKKLVLLNKYFSIEEIFELRKEVVALTEWSKSMQEQHNAVINYSILVNRLEKDNAELTQSYNAIQEENNGLVQSNNALRQENKVMAQNIQTLSEDFKALSKSFQAVMQFLQDHDLELPKDFLAEPKKV